MTLLKHFAADWSVNGHFKSNKLLLRHIKNLLTLLNVSGSMHTTIVGTIVPELKLVKVGSVLLHPVKESIKSFAFRVICWNGVVFIIFFLMLFKKLL